MPSAPHYRGTIFNNLRCNYLFLFITTGTSEGSVLLFDTVNRPAVMKVTALIHICVWSNEAITASLKINREIFQVRSMCWKNCRHSTQQTQPCEANNQIGRTIEAQQGAENTLRKRWRFIWPMPLRPLLCHKVGRKTRQAPGTINNLMKWQQLPHGFEEKISLFLKRNKTGFSPFTVTVMAVITDYFIFQSLVQWIGVKIFCCWTGIGALTKQMGRETEWNRLALTIEAPNITGSL